MQRVSSSSYGESAAVGQETMQRVQVTQQSGGGESWSISREVSSSPRKNQEPRGSLIRQVFLPIQPRPAWRAVEGSGRGGGAAEALHSGAGARWPARGARPAGGGSR